jgi:hypothetical protein
MTSTQMRETRAGASLNPPWRKASGKHSPLVLLMHEQLRPAQIEFLEFLAQINAESPKFDYVVNLSFFCIDDINQLM